MKGKKRKKKLTSQQKGQVDARLIKWADNTLKRERKEKEEKKKNGQRRERKGKEKNREEDFDRIRHENSIKLNLF